MVTTNLQKPRISVLMPVYNAEPFLESAVNSILNQSFRDFELLICDDGSTDDSLKILHTFQDARIQIYNNDHNQGVVFTSNKLFSLCQGELITFQDADDWSENERLALQEKAFSKDSALMLCGSQCVYLKGTKRKTSSFPITHAALVTALQNGETSVCCGASVMFRSTLLSTYKGYRQFFNGIGAEHLDFYWRMIDQEKFINLPNSLYNYRSTRHSFSQHIHNNPLKFYSTKLAYLAYWQRKITGTDFLDNKNKKNALIKDLLTRHTQDPSLTPSLMASTQLAFGNTQRFVKLLKKSICSNGLTLATIKAILTSIPLFILSTTCPTSIKRFFVRTSNLRFLKKYGIQR